MVSNIVGSPALRTDTIVWIFQLNGQVLEKKWWSSSLRASTQIHNTLREILSIPGDFSAFSETRASKTSTTVTVIVVN